MTIIDLWTRPYFNKAIVNGYIYSTTDFSDKDITSNTVLEDIDPVDFNNFHSDYMDVLVLGSGLPAITLQHTPVYYNYQNAEDDAFAANNWQGFVMWNFQNELVIPNLPNIGFVGGF